MLVTRRSPISGELHTLEIPCTEAQINDWQSGAVIQKAMPNVPADLREFLILGITPDEWRKTFG